MQKIKSLIFSSTVMAAIIVSSYSLAVGQEEAAPAIQLKKASTVSPTTPSNPNLPAYLKELEGMPVTTIEFAEEVFDFGEIKEGTIARHTFEFTNSGTHPLKVTNVKPSCGCTTPNWSKEVIAPGEKGFVEVEFNSRGRLGVQHKSITLSLNTESQRKVLRFKGQVVQK